MLISIYPICKTFYLYCSMVIHISTKCNVSTLTGVQDIISHNSGNLNRLDIKLFKKLFSLLM